MTAFLRPVYTQSGNTWCCNDGTRVVLASPCSLLQLTELERLTLQKVALSRVQAMELGTKINIPKGLLIYFSRLQACQAWP